MSLENFNPPFTTVGFGGITGFLLGYFIKKIFKILMLIFGGILALILFEGARNNYYQSE